MAIEGHPGSEEFLSRMAWLPPLFESLAEPAPLEG
jgi:hypothetical protein